MTADIFLGMLLVLTPSISGGGLVRLANARFKAVCGSDRFLQFFRLQR